LHVFRPCFDVFSGFFDLVVVFCFSHVCRYKNLLFCNKIGDGGRAFLNLGTEVFPLFVHEQ
jgi:hypothetical protein